MSSVNGNGNAWGGGDIAALVGALVKAQAAIRPAVKDAVNPHFKSQYASLASVWDAIREPLTKNGLAVIQQPATDGNLVSVRTLLLHSSGGWVAAECSATSRDAGPQAVGSVISYLRRYGLAAMVGVVADDDDDAEVAEASAKPAAPRKQPARTQPPKEDDAEQNATPAQINAIRALMGSNLLTDKERARINERIARGMTAAQAEEAIAWLRQVLPERRAEAEPEPEPPPPEYEDPSLAAIRIKLEAVKYAAQVNPHGGDASEAQRDKVRVLAADLFGPDTDDYAAFARAVGNPALGKGQCGRLIGLLEKVVGQEALNL